MNGLKAGVHWFDHGWSWDGNQWDWQDEGWVIDFFVQPREDFERLGQPIVDWCVARGIVLTEPVPNWESRKELIASVTPEQAFEFRLTWGATCRA
jgi:hypothetical protein